MRRESNLSQEGPSPKESRPEDMTASSEAIRTNIREELAPIEAKNTKAEQARQGNEVLRRNELALKDLTDQTEARATKGHKGSLSRLAEMSRGWFGMALLFIAAAGCGGRSTEKRVSPPVPESQITMAFRSILGLDSAPMRDGSFAVGMGNDFYKVSPESLEQMRKTQMEYDGLIKSARTKKEAQRLLKEGKDKLRSIVVGSEKISHDSLPDELKNKAKEKQAPQTKEKTEASEAPAPQTREDLVKEVIESLQFEPELAPEDPQGRGERGQLPRPKTMEQEVAEEIEIAAERHAVDIARRTGKDPQDIRRQLGLGSKEPGRVIVGSRAMPSRESGEPTPERYKDAYRSFRERIDAAMKPLEDRKARQLAERVQNQLETNQAVLEAGGRMLYDTLESGEPNEAVKLELEKVLEMSEKLLNIRDGLTSGNLNTEDALDQINRLKRIKNSVIMKKMEEERRAQQEKEEAEKRSKVDRSSMARALSGFFDVPVTENLDDDSLSLKVDVMNNEGKLEKKEYKVTPENFNRIKRFIDKAKENSDLDEKQKEFARKSIAVIISQLGQEIKEK